MYRQKSSMLYKLIYTPSAFTFLVKRLYVFEINSQETFATINGRFREDTKNERPVGLYSNSVNVTKINENFIGDDKMSITHKTKSSFAVAKLLG